MQIHSETYVAHIQYKQDVQCGRSSLVRGSTAFLLKSQVKMT
jgi:hypothetical protein